MRKEFTFLDQLEKIVNYSSTSDKAYIYIFRFVEARIKSIVEYMATSMYILGLPRSATRNSTYHRYSLVAKLAQVWKPVLDPLCHFSDSKYSKDYVASFLDTVHLDYETLFLQDDYSKMVCLNDSAQKSNSRHRLGSFPTTFSTASALRFSQTCTRKGLFSMAIFRKRIPHCILFFTFLF